MSIVSQEEEGHYVESGVGGKEEEKMRGRRAG